MNTFRCTVCGFQLQRPTQPFSCPQCGRQAIGLFRLVPAAPQQGGWPPQGAAPPMQQAPGGWPQQPGMQPPGYPQPSGYPQQPAMPQQPGMQQPPMQWPQQPGMPPMQQSGGWPSPPSVPQQPAWPQQPPAMPGQGWPQQPPMPQPPQSMPPMQQPGGWPQPPAPSWPSPPSAPPPQQPQQPQHQQPGPWSPQPGIPVTPGVRPGQAMPPGIPPRGMGYPPPPAMPQPPLPPMPPQQPPQPQAPPPAPPAPPPAAPPAPTAPAPAPPRPATPATPQRPAIPQRPAAPPAPKPPAQKHPAPTPASQTPATSAPEAGVTKPRPASPAVPQRPAAPRPPAAPKPPEAKSPPAAAEGESKRPPALEKPAAPAKPAIPARPSSESKPAAAQQRPAAAASENAPSQEVSRPRPVAPAQPARPRPAPAEPARPAPKAAVRPQRLVWAFPEAPPTEEQATPIRNAPAVDSAGRLILFQQQRVIALVEKDGKPNVAWEYVTGNRAPGPIVVGPQDRLWFHCADGYLHCVESATGKQAWPPACVGEPLGYAVPVVDQDGNTYVSAHEGGLILVDNRGRVQKPGRYYRSRQKFDAPGVIAAGVLYVGSEDGYVAAIELGPDRGTSQWSQATEQGFVGAVRSAPAVTADGVIIVVGQDDHLCGIASNGSVIWRTQMPGQMLGSPVFDRFGHIYIGVTQSPRGFEPRGLLICVDGNSHKIRWEYRAQGPVESTPVIGDDDVVYFGDNAGVIHAVNFHGRGLWTDQAGSPVRSAGTLPAPSRLAFGLDDETLLVLQCDSGGLATEGWPKIGRTLGQSGAG